MPSMAATNGARPTLFSNSVRTDLPALICIKSRSNDLT